MAGIYIHIPYCRKACHYCNFHFSTTRYNTRQMVDSLLKETVLQKHYFDPEQSGNAPSIATIYFGGGTPSILPAAWISELIECIKNNYPVDKNAEITLEANPDDINQQILADWQAAGVNRLSIGVQSFIDEDLQWMNRAHQAKEAYQAIKWAVEAGMLNYSLDLIYGTPYLTDALWQENLQIAAELGAPHLSAYALTVEPKTALFKLIEKGKIPPVDNGKQSQHFELLMDWAAQNGFEHYEISNLAKPGYRSRHNSSYWQGQPYLGLGPAAHSYDGLRTRKWNIDNNPLYLQGINKTGVVSTEEHLTIDNQINETIMIQLRMMEGLDLVSFEKKFGGQAVEVLAQQAKKAIEQGHLVHYNNHLVLTRAGKHFADHIAVMLFI
ncbi:radical SAM family heme chaperone HemW [Arachidicoccus ginsenosidivorans]|uniref:Heme chaperone HemW n=1 Tax=Arachidicoccus ginsenosidivorans TaxID=496057 RepID=A0A5B8VNS1_9BACT|nr:radical SAM family heme chaperone HemW [Arachidicoccus ginsenosidivorans]QEC72761.1 radical SAM family heme chaperone HemW [Arachidicoccus ginsenosidivorans]